MIPRNLQRNIDSVDTFSIILYYYSEKNRVNCLTLFFFFYFIKTTNNMVEDFYLSFVVHNFTPFVFCDMTHVCLHVYVRPISCRYDSYRRYYLFLLHPIHCSKSLDRSYKTLCWVEMMSTKLYWHRLPSLALQLNIEKLYIWFKYQQL